MTRLVTMAMSMEVSKRREFDSKSRENSFEISQHEIVPLVPICIAVHLLEAHARHRVDHVISDRISGHVYKPLNGTEQPVETVFMVVFDALELALVRVCFIDSQ